MRVLLAVTIGLCGATAAAAQAVPDRYGPARTGAVTVAAYSGATLSWPSKAAVREAPAAPVQAAQAAPVRPAPVIAERAYTLGSAAPTPAPSPAALRPARLYDTPPPQAAAQPAPAVQPAPPPRAMAAAGAPTRFYSLHREYGMAPDPTPPQSSSPGYVLIGPSDTAASPPQRDADADGDGPTRQF